MPVWVFGITSHLFHPTERNIPHMLLSDFSDAFIEKQVHSAAKSFARRNYWFHEDIYQIGFLALYEMRERLTQRHPPCQVLSARNIYYTVKREIYRALMAENQHEADRAFEVESRSTDGIDFTELLLLKDRWKLLTPKEKRVLKMIFFDGLHETQVAEKFDVSKQRINQIKEKALRKMR